MPVAVHILRSHAWLHDELLSQGATPPAGYVLAESRRTADVLVYLEPPWRDATAAERLTTLRPRDLARAVVYSQNDLPIPWAPGLYASLPASRAGRGFAGAFYVMPHHREGAPLPYELELARERTPDLLWSFSGTVRNAPVRQRLMELVDPRATVRDTSYFSDVVRWGWDSSHSAEAIRGFKEYAGDLGRAAFVVCPRGRGTGSVRLFEAMQAGRCPVIVSDDWLAPPLVDWGSCSLRVAEDDVARLPELLRDAEPQAEELGREARRLWEQHFRPERRVATLVAGAGAQAAAVSLRDRVALCARAQLLPNTLVRARRSVRTRLARRS